MSSNATQSVNVIELDERIHALAQRQRVLVESMHRLEIDDREQERRKAKFTDLVDFTALCNVARRHLEQVSSSGYRDTLIGSGLIARMQEENCKLHDMMSELHLDNAQLLHSSQNLFCRYTTEEEAHNATFEQEG